jgi:protein ImuA
MGFVQLSAAAQRAASVADALPDVWRASQVASYRTAAIATGHAMLDSELPDGGWPSRTLIELLVQQPGIGEMRLLQPALHRLAQRAIALIQPPHLPQTPAWTPEGFPVERLVWIKAKRAADALWAAEQVLRNGTCGALLLWQAHVRNESLRRLHLAAQAADVVFWLLRPIACAPDPSPAPLRLALRPAANGISVEIVKRRGPRRDDYLRVPLAGLPDILQPTEFEHASLDRRSPAVATTGSISSTLV